MAMPELQTDDCLSWGDALFLYLEREGMPLNIASLAVFEGKISLADCSDFVRSKLPLIPRYLQRVVIPPLNIGLPAWDCDPEFDMGNHMREVTLKHGTETELMSAAAKVLSVTMDRRHPLWDFTLLQGLNGDRTGIVVRAHHCLADGIAGVSLMNVLMDAEPVSRALVKKPRRFHAPPPRDRGALLLDGVMNSFSSLVQCIFTMQMQIMDLTQKTLAGAAQGTLSGINELLPELSAPAERLPFNIVCRGPQKFACGEIPLAELKAVREATGTTINDIVLTVLTAALRRYVELRGANLKGRRLRVAVPVSMRGNGGNDGALGNQISFLPISVPLDIRPAGKLLAAVHERMQFLKNAHAAEFVGLAGTLLGAIPLGLQALAGPVASQLPISLCNTICTNVPGPQVPLYLFGHKMLSWYPYVPIGGEMGLNCAMLSYNGTAYFGFTGDAQAAPHLGRLGRFLAQSFAELRRAAGIGRRRRQSPPRKPVTASKTAAGEERSTLAANA